MHSVSSYEQKNKTEIPAFIISKRVRLRERNPLTAIARDLRGLQLLACFRFSNLFRSKKQKKSNCNFLIFFSAHITILQEQNHVVIQLLPRNSELHRHEILKNLHTNHGIAARGEVPAAQKYGAKGSKPARSLDFISLEYTISGPRLPRNSS